MLNPPPAGGIPVPGILGCGDESFACDYCPPGPRVGFGSGPSVSPVGPDVSPLPLSVLFLPPPFSPFWTEDFILLVIVIVVVVLLLLLLLLLIIIYYY